MRHAIARCCLVILILSTAGPGASAEAEPAADVDALLKRLAQAEGAERRVAAEAILDRRMAAHEALFDGPAGTAEVRAELRRELRSQRDAEARAKGLVVHEWGSVMMLADHDGAKLDYLANDHFDVPPFVHRWESMQPFRPVAPQVIRKPILYFYPPDDRKMQATVDVRVMKGMFTQWYPKPTRIEPMPGENKRPEFGVGRTLWARFTIDPSAGEKLAEVDRDHPWWHVARDVDASPVTVGEETEKFLFYRGMAKPRDAVKITGDEAEGAYRLHNSGERPVHDIIVMRVNKAGGDYRLVRRLAPDEKAAIDFNDPAESGAGWTRSDAALARFGERLEAAGLYPKEAKGLTTIWGAFFFDRPGVRMLYVMPEAQADAMLPLVIDPRPSDVARALVVQVECQTEAMRKRIEGLIDKLADADFEVRQAAERQLRSLDRFAIALLRKAVAEHPDEEVRVRAGKVLDSIDEGE